MAATYAASDATAIAENTQTTGTGIAQITPDDVYLRMGPVCLADKETGVSLFVPAGWYAYPFFDSGGSIFNYDPGPYGNDGPPPQGLIKVQIGLATLPTGQSFEQWVSDRIAETISDERRPTVTGPAPMHLGNFDGLSFVISGNLANTQEIVLLLDDSRIIDIGLWPSDSSAQPEALAIFADSLAVTPEGSCRQG